MDVRRRPVKQESHQRPVKPPTAGELLKSHNQPKPSDTLPPSLYLTNGLFFVMFFSVMYFLLHRWREKIRNAVPLHVLTLAELAAVASLIASVTYLVGFFGIEFVQSIFRPSPDSWDIDDDISDQVTEETDSQTNIYNKMSVKTAESDQLILKDTDTQINKPGKIPDKTVESLIILEETNKPTNIPSKMLAKTAGSEKDVILYEDMPIKPCGQALTPRVAEEKEMTMEKKKPPPATEPTSNEDEEIIKLVVGGSVPSYALESKLGDCKRAAAIRRAALQRTTGKSLSGLPLEGFDYDSILGQCCEMPVGYVQIPVGIAGPLLLNGREFWVPMATTEGCLVASTNRGCKAVYVSGGATCIVLKDGMTRAPVVRFATAKRAAELKLFLEDPLNFDTLAVVFNKSSRFARLQSVKCAIAGKNLYIRFCCATGDAMGMNMVSKGVQNVLDFLHHDFPDMDVMGISGNYCADKKPAAVNWIEGRGKSVVCEAVIKEEVVQKVLKTTVHALVELNMLKNLTGSAMAGALGGFNAHASNIVSAVYLATGQDPAQNVESSHCITMMEAVNDGKDLHISVTMPSIEVGTVGGGTQLASQSACLNLLGVKGASKDEPGSNSRILATIVAGSVLAGELSLMSAISAGQLVKSHMKYNRSTRDMSKLIS